MTGFTPSSGNVYADLGYADPEGMRATANLVTHLRHLAAERPLAEIAQQLGLPQDELAAIFKGQFRHVDQTRLAGYIALLEDTGGQHPGPQASPAG